MKNVCKQLIKEQRQWNRIDMTIKNKSGGLKKATGRGRVRNVLKLKAEAKEGCAPTTTIMPK